MEGITAENAQQQPDSSQPPKTTESSQTTSLPKAPNDKNEVESENKAANIADKESVTVKPTVKKKSSNHKKLGYLSSVQKDKVDSVFLKMFGYSWGTMPMVESSKSQDRSYILLKRIFCAKSAAQILHNTSAEKHGNSETTWGQTKIVALPAAESSTVTSFRDVRPQTSSTTPLPVEKQPVSPQGSSAVAAPSGGADALLQQMQGPKTTSTIMKTAMDWESFKEESGALGEKLEQHAESKAAYLKRQDFLNRVDHRKFEQERQERERNRSRKS